MSALASVILAFVCFALSWVLTWLVRAAMQRTGIYDIPSSGRKAHKAPVAYEGGVAMYLAFIIGLLYVAFTESSFFFMNQQMRGLIYGATLVVGLGIADDLLDLPAWLKFIVQLGIGWMMWRFDFRIPKITNPFGEEIVFWQYASIGGTAIWYAFLMNGLNMVDGLDGLAAGIAGICAMTLCAISANQSQPFSIALCVILTGICAGFLPFNFSPASIFMGDAGSLLLGFLLASITLLSSTKALGSLALLIPMLAVGLPLFETVFAFIRRTIQGQHPFRGDRRHLHHRFLALGFSERRTVLTFYYITAYFGVTAYVLQRLEAKATLALVVIIGVGMVLLVENLRYLEKTKS